MAEALQQALGSQLRTTYRLGQTAPTADCDGVSQQLLVIDETPSFTTFVDVLQPVLGVHALPDSLALASHTSWRQYLQAHPALAATWPGGTFSIGEVAQPTVWSGLDRAAYLCRQHFATSVLLAPALVDAAAFPILDAQLDALIGLAVPQSEEAELATVERLAVLQDELNRQLDRLPDNTWPSYFHHAPAEAPLPDLHAIFKTEHDQVILVFDKLTGEAIREMDWASLAAGVGDSCTGLHIVTVDQLQLLLGQETPLDVVFRRFQLDWGHDPITAVNPQPQFLFRHAARLPLHILINLLPHACLTATEEADWHQVIHDFQNKLLNVQLEHEIMVRLKLVDRFVPPTALPEREAETAVRINAIFNQLQDWASFYVAEMDQAK
ncbi:MAG: hypothetical protein AAF614_17635 [Chloroflexota bacterium]